MIMFLHLKKILKETLTGTPACIAGAGASAESPSLSALDLVMEDVLPPLLGGILSRTFLRFTC